MIIETTQSVTERDGQMKKWGWVMQNGVTMALMLGLGTLLSQVPLFHDTLLGSTKLRAAQGVQFLSFGGTLWILWRFGQRSTCELPSLWPKMRFLQPMILPMTTLIVITAGHPVCGQVLSPFLGKTGRNIYNWLFIIAIVAAALWVVVSWYTKAALMLQIEEGTTEEPVGKEPSYQSGNLARSAPASSTREEPV